jgi:hypothetical protein
VNQILNRFIMFDCMYCLVLPREKSRPLELAETAKITSRLAIQEDIDSMQRDPRLRMHEPKITYFKQGDACMLSFLDGALAGYTLAHDRGCPELVPGLVISVPADLLYNYASLTLAEFRGHGLQPHRHYLLLNSDCGKDKRGLLTCVKATNWSSLKGLAKIGYERVGAIRLIGSKKHFLALFSPSLKRMKIRRLRAPHDSLPNTRERAAS